MESEGEEGSEDGKSRDGTLSNGGKRIVYALSTFDVAREQESILKTRTTVKLRTPVNAAIVGPV